MDKITQSLTLDLVDIQHNVVNAIQGDRLTRDLDITITNNGYAYNILPDYVVRLRGHRPDGKYIFYDGEITDGKNGMIHVDIPPFLLSSSGRAKLDIGIYQNTNDGDTEIASTESFILYIPDNIFSEDEVVNSDNGSVLSKLIDTAEKEIEEMNELENDLQQKIDSHYFALFEDLQSHNSSTSAHGDIREFLSDLTTRLNALADSDDTTLDQLSEIVAYIKDNRDLIDSITTSKVSVSDIVDNLTSTAANKPLSAKQGKVLNDLITALTNTVDSKTESSDIKNGKLTLRRKGQDVGYFSANQGEDEIIELEDAYPINKVNSDGYVPKGEGHPNKVWGTDKNGIPEWRDVVATSAETSNKLSTTRTIFGQSFDGSANVAGKGTFYGTATDTANQRFKQSALEIRENNLNGNASTDIKYAPSIGFHWSNVIGARLLMNSSGAFNFLKQDGVSAAPVYGTLISEQQIGLYDTEKRLYYPIKAYGDGAGYGTQLIIGGGGNTFIGAGEAAGSLYTAFQTASNLGTDELYAKSAENMYIAADGVVYIYANVNSTASRKGIRLTTGGNLEPVRNSNMFLGTIDAPFHSVTTKNIFLPDNGTIIFGEESTMIYKFNNKLLINGNNGIELGPITNDLTVKTLKISKVATGKGMQMTLTDVANEGLILYDTSFCPLNDNVTGLGGSGHRWRQIVSMTSTISTSDRNLKKQIKDLASDDRYIKFFMMLQPKSYLFKDGESGRTHVGFISQDVEDAMEECGLSSLEFAGFCKDVKMETKQGENEWDKEEVPVLDEEGNPVYEYSLRYEEFIAMNTMMIQKLYKRMLEIEDILSDL